MNQQRVVAFIEVSKSFFLAILAIYDKYEREFLYFLDRYLIELKTVVNDEIYIFHI